MGKSRAAIYARFSSHNQREESIDIQVENSRKFCEREGLTVVHVYSDYARTGRNTNRTEFQRMMSDAALGLFDYVVIYKVTRIMRNRDEMALARLTLRKCGVEILYAGEDISSGSSGVLQLGMLEVLAEWESAIDSERIRDGIQKNAERCMANGCHMYGWDIVDGVYVINEHEAAVLRRMRDMLISGSTIAEIVRALDAERTRAGVKFRQATVTKLLRRCQNAGTYSYAGVVVEGGMPAIWPKGDQALIDQILKNRHRPHKKSNSIDFPLTGKLWCAKCDRPMGGTSGTSKTGKTHYYYKCRECGRTVRRDQVEECVKRNTLNVLSHPETREHIADIMAIYQEEVEQEEPESKRLKKSIKQIDTQYENIWRAIENGMAPPGGRERIDDLNKRRAQLEEELAAAEALEKEDAVDRDAVLKWLESVDDEMSIEEILGLFVRYCELDGDTLRIYFAFDHWGDGIKPAKTKKEAEPSPTVARLEESSTNVPMVEVRRIELRSKARP
jgi:site-specific DNA recombinase